MSKRFGSSRDSARKTAVINIQTALELTRFHNTQYPMPDDHSAVYDNTWALAWYQWVFGTGVVRQVSMIADAPQDPRTKEYYKYSITWDKKSYEVVAELENEDNIAYISRAYASQNIPYIMWDYRWYLVTYTGGKYNLRNTPSLFVPDEKLVDGYRFDEWTWQILQHGVGNNSMELKKLDITNLVNGTDVQWVQDLIASTYNVSSDTVSATLNSASWLDDVIKIASNTTSSCDCPTCDCAIHGVCWSDNTKQNLVWSPTNLCLTGNSTTPYVSWSLYLRTCQGINGWLTANCSALALYTISWDDISGRKRSNDTYAQSCYDYKFPDSNTAYNYLWDTWDGVYWIDPTGTNPFKVYCDMSTDGWGWTLVLKTCLQYNESWEWWWTNLWDNEYRPEELLAFSCNGTRWGKMADTTIQSVWSASWQKNLMCMRWDNLDWVKNTNMNNGVWDWTYNAWYNPNPNWDSQDYNSYSQQTTAPTTSANNYFGRWNDASNSGCACYNTPNRGCTVRTRWNNWWESHAAYYIR